MGLGFDLVSFIQEHGDAISFIGFNYYFDNTELLSAAAIENRDGVMVEPSAETIGDGSYNPLVRSISMNLLGDPASLANTIPLLKFGFHHPDLVTETGMVPVQGKSLEEMMRRLDGAPYASSEMANGDDDDDENIALIIGLAVAGILVLLCLILALYVIFRREK